MLIRKPPHIPSSEITSERNYLNRRQFLRDGTIAAGTFLAAPGFGAVLPAATQAELAEVVRSQYSTDEEPNSFSDISTYNNYYEFGTGKEDPSRNSGEFEPRPWTLTVSGHAEKTGTFDLEDFVKPYRLEERIYRMRCVEAWSMVIPWVGIPLAKVIEQFQPTSRAKFVAFETLHDPERMPGQRLRVLRWPYREGLT
ncbi:MAG TPA: protein-methionine-sulfoxide reductase catalytic subunit MsrP, partial [Woeseiaceae bacterium]|nr:protein-methionine-sulfoxide reductase catalytic subunit MsrP [Woeseiaceae bacterium]